MEQPIVQVQYTNTVLYLYSGLSMGCAHAGMRSINITHAKQCVRKCPLEPLACQEFCFQNAPACFVQALSLSSTGNCNPWRLVAKATKLM